MYARTGGRTTQKHNTSGRVWQVSAVADWPARLYRAVDRAWRSRDKLLWSSVGARTYDQLIWPTTTQLIITLGASTFLELSRYHVSTIDIPKQNFLSPEFDKVPEGSTLIFAGTWVSLYRSVVSVKRSLRAKKELDPSIHFDRTPTCDKQTDTDIQTDTGP